MEDEGGGTEIVALSASLASRERILIYGPWGSGKSHCWITLAQWLQRTGSKAKVYVLVTDFSKERYLEGWDSSSVVAEEVGDWGELQVKSAEFMRKAGKDDFLVIDLISDSHNWVRDAVAIKVMGKGFSEWMLDSSGEMEKIGGSYGTNWGMMNGSYRSWYNNYVARFPGHVIAIARSREFMRDKNSNIIGGVDQKVKDEFGSFNLYPEGHSDLPYQFHTVLLTQEAKREDWRINTIRERTIPNSSVTRARLKNHQLKDFVVDYLIGVAGWTVEDIYLKAFGG